jgi:hypothetical protein
MTREDLQKEIDAVNQQVEGLKQQLVLADGARQAFVYLLNKLVEEENKEAAAAKAMNTAEGME